MEQREQPVKAIMTKKVMSADLKTSAMDCAKAMAKGGVSCAVITQAGAPIGVVTERDLVSKVLADGLDPGGVFAQDIMSTPLITVSEEATIAQAATMMAGYRIRRLVVVDRFGGMVGIITTGDIARSLAEKHGYRDPKFNALARYKDGAEEGPYR